MDIALKNIKHSEFASHETYCYEATLYVDGKRLALVSNDGRGGCDYIYPAKGVDIEVYKTTLKDVETYLDSASEEDCSDVMKSELLTLYCHQCVSDFLLKRDFKRQIKKLMTIEDGTIYTYQGTVNERNIAALNNKDGCVCLNGMDAEKAFDMYKEAVGS
ncbi:hypothetical protein A3715_10450 [Oleiphilus sp. HI0009]|nr:hypothetical protein A3715_10450 [Oleiphilus sp. HI0009]